MKTEQTNALSGIMNWFGESVLVKLAMIGFLTLLLLIPSVAVQDLIQERQQRQDDVIAEISDKWSGSQVVEGPVMVLPYKTLLSQRDAEGKVTYKEVLSHIYLLPDVLNMESEAEPEILHRGIFEAVVYNSKIRVNGKFSALELKKSGIDPEMIQWDKVMVDIGLSDLKGLKNNPSINLDGTNYNVEPDFNSLKLFSNNLIILPDLSTDKKTDLNFRFDLDLRGSSELNFLHLGKTTTVKVQGKWNNPSFTGRYLPEERNISDAAFSASWKMPYFNRPFPQQWVKQNAILNSSKDSILSNSNATFGVKFKLPVDQYQKTMRTAKYAILIILLTFLSLFFTELLTKRKVHLLQYVLIGVAMSIYYTLLLSFTEQVGFNAAYLIASVATVTLVGSFIVAVLKSQKPALIFSGILTGFYGFIFVIIQLQDMALLFASIGLFIMVAIMMYLSTRIEWNRSGLIEGAGYTGN